MLDLDQIFSLPGLVEYKYCAFRIRMPAEKLADSGVAKLANTDYNIFILDIFILYCVLGMFINVKNLKKFTK